jgi:hypothetical protein
MSGSTSGWPRPAQWGMLRPSFIPPAAIRAVRDFTRARTDLVHERTRVLQRLEKLLVRHEALLFIGWR